MKMSKIAQGVALAGALSCAAGTASALTVAGITWDPDSLVDFIAQSALWETVALNDGETISGYGSFTFLNGDQNFDTGAELTYVFSGFTLANAAAGLPALTGAAGEDFAFTGGILQVYADAAKNFNFTNAATAADGVLFLDLLAADPDSDGFTLTGSTTQNSTQGLGIAGQGSGFFDVTGGVAQVYFDTDGQIGGTDFLYTSSFQPLANAIGIYTHGGTAEVSGTSVVPVPGTLALAGLGLMGLGFKGRKARKAVA